ncbi:hypothetical protein M5D96_003892 [Drosophila gunungcola]|uniref:Uncharacterized protein n=1 Tax=Drosophila gunungcola TaxID=103775 RepID=A0A9P9YSX7_9MUSC|nr:hypothetical protein M5D96_003892 [Drosophila gunungcola]
MLYEFVRRYDSHRFISSIGRKNNKRRRRRWTWHQNVKRNALHVEIFEHITLLRYKRKTKAATTMASDTQQRSDNGKNWHYSYKTKRKIYGEAAHKNSDEQWTKF